MNGNYFNESKVCTKSEYVFVAISSIEDSPKLTSLSASLHNSFIRVFSQYGFINIFLHFSLQEFTYLYKLY